MFLIFLFRQLSSSGVASVVHHCPYGLQSYPLARSAGRPVERTDRWTDAGRRAGRQAGKEAQTYTPTETERDTLRIHSLKTQICCSVQDLGFA